MVGDPQSPEDLKMVGCPFFVSSLILIIINFDCGHSLTCYCYGHCPGDENENGTCIAAENSYCYVSYEEVHNTETNLKEAEFSYGCLPADESGYMQVRWLTS